MSNILEWFVAISVVLVGLSGIGVFVYFTVWLYAHLFNLLLQLFKVHKEFTHFVRDKYKIKVYTPKLSEEAIQRLKKNNPH